MELLVETVFLNGYKLTITRSIKLILFFFNSFKCLDELLFARIPPYDKKGTILVSNAEHPFEKTFKHFVLPAAGFFLPILCIVLI